jgi:hypothetical protein
MDESLAAGMPAPKLTEGLAGVPPAEVSCARRDDSALSLPILAINRMSTQALIRVYLLGNLLGQWITGDHSRSDLCELQ